MSYTFCKAKWLHHPVSNLFHCSCWFVNLDLPAEVTTGSAAWMLGTSPTFPWEMAEVLCRAQLEVDESLTPSLSTLPLEVEGGSESAEEHTFVLWLVLLCTNRLYERTEARNTSRASKHKVWVIKNSTFILFLQAALDKSICHILKHTAYYTAYCILHTCDCITILNITRPSFSRLIFGRK